MRFGLAIASLVIAGFLLILGIGQRTFLAGPSEIVYSVDAARNADYAVIPAAELSAVPGQANVVVTGAEGFAAVGSRADVEAWVEPFSRTELLTSTQEKRLAGDVVSGDRAGLDEDELAALEEIDPAGSDLWLDEQRGTGRMAVSASEDQSILLRTGGGSSVTVNWVQDLRTPFAGPLLVAGGAFAILGLVLYLLAVDHDRRGLGPRRGRKGPLLGIRSSFSRTKRRPPAGEPAESGKGSAASADPGAAAGANERRALRRLSVPSMGLAAVLLLSGCSASYWPDFSQQEAAKTEAGDANGSQGAPVPVVQAQIDRILADVSKVAGEGDDALDAQLLKTRFDDDALAQRAANYQIRAAVPDYEVALPRITDEQLDYELVQSTEGWPRTLFVTVASETVAKATEDEDDGSSDQAASAKPASPSLALVLTQESAHDNYLVSRIFALRGGIAMPAAAPSDEGTALLADDLASLVLPPGEVGEAYAKLLAGDTESEQSELFDVADDTVLAKSGAAWVSSAKQAATDGGYDVSYGVTAAPSENPITSLSTGVGGALVATTVLERRVEEQSGSYQPKAVGAVAAISGLSGAQKRIVSTLAHQLLFFVPSGTSGDKIQLLGYTTELVGATN